MRGILGEYGLFLVEIIMGTGAMGILALTFEKLQPVVMDGMNMFIGG